MCVCVVAALFVRSCVGSDRTEARCRLVVWWRLVAGRAWVAGTARPAPHGAPARTASRTAPQYDGDLKLPTNYLVPPPAISGTSGAVLAAACPCWWLQAPGLRMAVDTPAPYVCLSSLLPQTH